VALF
jgi:hypothetical protein